MDKLIKREHFFLSIFILLCVCDEVTYIVQIFGV